MVWMSGDNQLLLSAAQFLLKPISLLRSHPAVDGCNLLLAADVAAQIADLAD